MVIVGRIIVVIDHGYEFGQFGVWIWVGVLLVFGFVFEV